MATLIYRKCIEVYLSKKLLLTAWKRLRQLITGKGNYFDIDHDDINYFVNDIKDLGDNSISNLMYLMMPSSDPSAKGLYKASTISTLGDCALTDALYLEMSGQHREPTT